MKKLCELIVGGAIFCWVGVQPLNAAELKWTHFTIDEPLPGASWGTAGIPLADFDGDGDLDCAISRDESGDTNGFWWYERKSDSVWVRHAINVGSGYFQGLAAAALDVDHDGWPDLIFDQVWFRNPGTLAKNPDTPWEGHIYDHVKREVHDIVAADINGDGWKDIVTFNGDTLKWYDTSHSLSVTTVVTGIGNSEGGPAPHGFGDLNGDGHVDLVIPGFWFENPGNGEGKWTRHSWLWLPIPKACYGPSIRSWVADVDGDGENDIVYSDSDTGYGHVYWVRNLGKGKRWIRYELPDPPTEPGVAGTGSWHSLGVADFNGDGNLDIFAGEQEDPDNWHNGKLPMKPKGLKPRGVIWINSGSNPPTFKPYVIHEGNPGWHDACIGDVDGDGDVDIVSKIWNKDGPTYHADYWRNDTVSKKK